MQTCWEIFLLKCAEQSSAKYAIEALNLLQLNISAQEKDRFHKLVNYFIDSVVRKEYINN